MPVLANIDFVVFLDECGVLFVFCGAIGQVVESFHVEREVRFGSGIDGVAGGRRGVVATGG